MMFVMMTPMLLLIIMGNGWLGGIVCGTSHATRAMDGKPNNGMTMIFFTNIYHLVMLLVLFISRL